MLDHVGFAVTNAEVSRTFYEKALAPLGLGLQMSITPDQNGSQGTVHGFGKPGDPFLWLGDNEAVGEGTHIALRASNRAEVDAFHSAAIAAGGRDNGAPGIRENYHSNYYAAFVFDPDGINLEAVCHEPE